MKAEPHGRRKQGDKQVGLHLPAREALFCRAAFESCGLDPDLFPKGNLFSALNKVGLREDGR